MTAVTYAAEAGIATITLDDGKANALSPATLAALDAAVARAEADALPVVLAGRPGTFSAGFDLSVLGGGGAETVEMLRAGFDLAHRLLRHPTPVVVACTGHAMAMGAFLLLAVDYRIGVAGAPHRIVANEVAIGLTMPRAAVELCRERLVPAQFQRAVVLAEAYTPDTAVAAGFLDAVVPEAELSAAATNAARRFGQLDAAAHAGTKRRARDESLRRLAAAIDADHQEMLAALAEP